MSDEPEILGDNQSADLKSRVERLIEILDDIDEKKADAKQIRDTAKADGYDMKAFNQVVKEKRKGTDYQASQLSLELVLDAYRAAVGNQTDLEKAQEAARREATVDPDEKKAKRKKSSKVVQFPGGSKPN
jgi:uncharacterized protein (UPF0335 family)